MKIKFTCDSGANNKSENSEVVDLAEYQGCGDQQARTTWDAMSDDEKKEMATEWAWNNGLEIWCEEVDG